MTKIQQKIWLLVILAVAVMGIIWLALTHVTEQNQQKSNEVLKRYMEINDVSQQTKALITSLNTQLVTPSAYHAQQTRAQLSKVRDLEQELETLRNDDNGFRITSYRHLLESVTDTSERVLRLVNEQELEEATMEFNEATRIANYISEMTMTLLSEEMATYNGFYGALIETSEQLNKLALFVLALITVVLLAATYGFSYSITKPVDELTRAANDLAEGHFDRPVKVESKDELAFLASTFEHMRVNINEYIDELTQKAHLEQELQKNKLLLKESQLKSLQNQMNPHFLFNTLNTLSKKAYLDGAEETSDLLVDVAGLLRYNLKNRNQAVPLEEEVAVIAQYMAIQQARFADRLTYTTSIGADLSVLIPSFTLQPLVENAVIHGIEPVENGGTVKLNIKTVPQGLQIQIMDDGQGINAEQLQRIQAPQSEAHIGFYNVQKRLELFYGQTNLLQITSSEGQGTVVTIHIPREERADDA